MDNLAVITGASGGLGRHLAIEMVRRGVHVVGLGRRADALDETAQAAGKGFTPVVADVSDASAVAHAFEAADKIGTVNILINNAAVYPRRDILDETPQSFAQTMGINLGGVVNCSHAALARMVPSGAGRIMNVSTFADVAPLPASAAYSTSKGAQRIFTRCLVADLGDRFPGIVINDWMPGMLATTMGVAHGTPPEEAAKWGAAMALWHDASINGTVWEEDHEIPPHRGLKARVKDKLLLRKPVIRRLASDAS